jgi:hypothetical protein
VRVLEATVPRELLARLFVFGLICGREWFVEPGVTATTASGDIL